MTPGGALVIGGDYRGLGIVRSLGRQGIPVWVAQRQDVIAGCSRYARRRLAWPAGTETEQTKHLLTLADVHGLDGWVLFPTSDEAAWLVSRNHGELSTRYRLTTSPWSLYSVAADKRLVYARAKSIGVPVPRTWLPASIDEVASTCFEFPVILKPAMRIVHNAFTDAKAWRVDDRDALMALYAKACGLVAPDEVMIQELIPGGADGQLAFAAVCDRGDAIAFVTVRRGRQYPIEFGRASTFVETIDAPDIEQISQRLLTELSLSGLVEVEFKLDPRDNTIKLLDVNPRAWGWHSVGTATGIEFAHLAWRLARDEAVARAQARPGVRWVRLSMDLPVSMREIAAGRMRLGLYLRSLRPPIAGPIAAADDPLPVLLDLPLLARRLAKRRIGKQHD